MYLWANVFELYIYVKNVSKTLFKETCILQWRHLLISFWQAMIDLIENNQTIHED